MRLLITVLLVAVFCSACNEQKMAARKTSWLHSHDYLGEACLKFFPVRPDSIVTRDTTIFDTIPGEGTVIHDTIPCKDSIIYRTHQCPDQQVIIKTRLRDTIIYKDNPYQRGVYEQQLRNKDKVIQAKDEQVTKLQKNIDRDNWWKIAFIILASCVVVFLILKISKRI